jgi:hypothetical protein
MGTNFKYLCIVPQLRPSDYMIIINYPKVRS